jgi:hypothetical protein
MYSFLVKLPEKLLTVVLSDCEYLHVLYRWPLGRSNTTTSDLVLSSCSTTTYRELVTPRAYHPASRVDRRSIRRATAHIGAAMR